MKIKPLAWDSEFFNLKIGASYFKDDINMDLDQLKAYDLVYLFDPTCGINPDDLRFKNHQITHSETRVTYQGKPQEPFKNIPASNILINRFDGKPTDDLIDLALLSGSYSRFKLDPNFTRHQFEQLYIKWLENSLFHKFADDVFIAHINEKIVGFVTLKYDQKNRIGSIGLIAVDPSVQGRGVGSELMQFVRQTIHGQGLQSFVVSTQLENKLACSFYERNGLHLIEQINIHHIWKN